MSGDNVRICVSFLIVICALLSIHPVYGIDKNREQNGYIGSTRCIECHDDTRNVKIHSKIIVGCEMCHGPGYEHYIFNEKKKKSFLFSLLKFKANQKINSSVSSEVCSYCHRRAEDDKIILVADDMIMNRQQHSEMLHNRKSDPRFRVTCLACHDPHASSESKNGLTRECVDCHTGKFKMEIKITAMSGLSCRECHMPYASRATSDSMVKGYHKGDGVSHIFGISVDSHYTLDDGTGHAALNEDGFARLTVEMTCAACHKSGEAHDMSREEMLEMVEKIH